MKGYLFTKVTIPQDKTKSNTFWYQSPKKIYFGGNAHKIMETKERIVVF